MSINLNPVLNAELLDGFMEPLEPYIDPFAELDIDILTVTRNRRCGYCGMTGHLQPNCRRAQSDGHNLHLRIINGMRNVQGNVDEWTKYLLTNMTVRQLKLLMRTTGVEGPGSTFIRTLENYRIVPLGTSSLRFKQDRITVMMWFYLNQSRPINPFNQNQNQNQNINRKFNIQTTVIDNSSPFDCPICLNHKESKEKVTTNCNHEVCQTCISNYLDHVRNDNVYKNPCCSLCRSEITILTLTNLEYKTNLSNKYII